ncbi:hypothetical protein BGX26_007327 [Mortierella sp. AD094]|nr:hypothetical protein BGX26_007327 [Mortierella sp. AD094]
MRPRPPMMPGSQMSMNTPPRQMGGPGMGMGGPSMDGPPPMKGAPPNMGPIRPNPNISGNEAPPPPRPGPGPGTSSSSQNNSIYGGMGSPSNNQVPSVSNNYQPPMAPLSYQPKTSHSGTPPSRPAQASLSSPSSNTGSNVAASPTPLLR